MVLRILEILDMFLSVIDNFSEFGWTIPLENKNAQTIEEAFEKILISSK